MEGENNLLVLALIRQTDRANSVFIEKSSHRLREGLVAFMPFFAVLLLYTYSFCFEPSMNALFSNKVNYALIILVMLLVGALPVAWFLGRESRESKEMLPVTAAPTTQLKAVVRQPKDQFQPNSFQRLRGWDLSFVLPSGWVLVPAYADGELLVNARVASKNSEVFFQNSKLTIYRGGANPPPGKFTDKYAMFAVERLSSNFKLPSGVTPEEKGQHLFHAVHSQDEDGGGAGSPSAEYFYQGSLGIYHLSFFVSGIELKDIDSVLATLQEEI